MIYFFSETFTFWNIGFSLVLLPVPIFSCRLQLQHLHHHFSVVFHCALREHDLNYNIKNINLRNLDSSQIKDIFSFVYFFSHWITLQRLWRLRVALMVNSMSLYHFVRILYELYICTVPVCVGTNNHVPVLFFSCLWKVRLLARLRLCVSVVFDHASRENIALTLCTISYV